MPAVQGCDRERDGFCEGTKKGSARRRHACRRAVPLPRARSASNLENPVEKDVPCRIQQWTDGHAWHQTQGDRPPPCRWTGDGLSQLAHDLQVAQVSQLLGIISAGHVVIGHVRDCHLFSRVLQEVITISILGQRLV